MKTRFLIFPLLILFFQQTKAQNNSRVLEISSLEDAWNYALKNNPDQKTSIRNIEKSKTELRVSESYFLPDAIGSFAGQINTKLASTAVPGELFGKPGQTMEVQFGQKYNYNTGISISKSVLDFQNLIQIKLAQNEMQTTQLQSEAFEQNLKQQVAVYYYLVLISQEALKLYHQNLVFADSIESLTEQKFQQGIINISAENQATISRNNIEQQIINTEIYLLQYQNSLKILLGVDVDTELKSETLDLLQVPISSGETGLGKDKNLPVRENMQKSAKLKVDLQKSAFLPKLNFIAYYGEQQFRNQAGMSLKSADWNPVNYIGLNLQIPIFTGFTNRNKLKSSEIENLTAQSDWEETIRKSTLNDELLLNEFDQSRKMLKPVSENYQLFLQNRQTAEQQLKEGIISRDVYFKIFEDFLNAENSYLSALSVFYNYYSTIISREN
jgi:outer membrane protein TolC